MTSGSRLTANERQAAALRLRKAGRTFEDIAAELGYAGHQGAYKAVKAALQKTLQEPADELRKLEGERLDVMLAAIWPKIEKGDTWAIDRALGIMDRRAKLFGLDAPTKREDTLTVMLQQAAAAAAQQFGLDPGEVIAEAEQIIAEGKT